MHIAACYGHKSVVELLIKHKADVNTRNKVCRQSILATYYRASYVCIYIYIATWQMLEM